MSELEHIPYLAAPVNLDALLELRELHEHAPNDMPDHPVRGPGPYGAVYVNPSRARIWVQLGCDFHFEVLSKPLHFVNYAVWEIDQVGLYEFLGSDGLEFAMAQRLAMYQPFLLEVAIYHRDEDADYEWEIIERKPIPVEHTIGCLLEFLCRPDLRVQIYE